MERILQLDVRDNVLIALSDLSQGETVDHAGDKYTLVSKVPAKHKFATEDMPVGAAVRMYGVLVGKTSQAVRRGEVLTTANLHHEAATYHEKAQEFRWNPPDVLRWKQRRFMGYVRSDGQVGTFGASYLAWDQYFASMLRPPHLVAMFALVGGANFYDEYGYPGGVPNVGWPRWILNSAATSPQAARNPDAAAPWRWDCWASGR